MRFLPVKNFAVSLGRQRLEFRRSIAPQEPEQECDTRIFDTSDGFQPDFLRAATLGNSFKKSVWMCEPHRQSHPSLWRVQHNSVSIPVGSLDRSAQTAPLAVRDQAGIFRCRAEAALRLTSPIPMGGTSEEVERLHLLFASWRAGRKLFRRDKF